MTEYKPKIGDEVYAWVPGKSHESAEVVAERARPKLEAVATRDGFGVENIKVVVFDSFGFDPRFARHWYVTGVTCGP